MRLRTLITVTAALLVVSAGAEAQGGADVGGGGRGWRIGMMGGGPRGTLAPLSPDSLTALVGLDAAQRQRYTTLHEQLMRETKPGRDSLRTITDLMRGARQSGDRSAATQYMGTLRQLHDGLMQRHKTFDTAVQDLLTDPQEKKYDQWLEEWKKEMTQRRGRGRRP